METEAAIRIGRRLFGLATGAVISILIGWVFEALFSEAALRAALEAQKTWLAVVSGFEPFTLFDSFMRNLGDVHSGRAGFSLEPAPPLDPSGFNPPIHPSQKPSAIQSLPRALAITFNELTSAGGGAGWFATLQFALGAFGYVVMHSRNDEFGRLFPTSAAGWLIGVPIGVVLAASALGFAMKWLMIGALVSLGWITGLAAFCAGCAGVIGFCWLVFLEMSKSAAASAL